MADLLRLLRAERLSAIEYDLTSAIGRYMTECLAKAEGAASPELRAQWLGHAAEAERALQMMKGVCTVLWTETANDVTKELVNEASRVERG